jgi:hypothetical protein
MDDDFLSVLRRDPAPDFARRLRVRLREQEETVPRGVATRAAKWSVFAASLALVAFAFTFPSVRAGAQAFLDWFRVVNVAGLSFDAERLQELTSSGLDLPAILGEQVEVLQEPSGVVSYGTLEDAAVAAGARVLVPAWLPVGWERTGIEVTGESAARLTASSDKLQRVLDALAIDDIDVPVGLDGQTATVRVPPIVRITYRNGESMLGLFQARSPEVSFPTGMDLPKLAEIGLRIAGLDRDEAYRFAQSIDWRSTLIVPVPAAAASFRQVDVQGQSGLMIEPIGGTDERRAGNVLLWSSDSQVFAISGSLRPSELLEMAQTMQ